MTPELVIQKETKPKLTLNEDQQKAADFFFQFLLGNEPEMVISGPGGTGKTFLLGYLVDEILPRYKKMCNLLNIPVKYESVVMTATTNPAAEVLSQNISRETHTIHSYLGLKIYDNYKTGESELSKSPTWDIKKNVIIIIDEFSMIDSKLVTFIKDSVDNCKIVYVGDHCQLSPVKERISPIVRRNLPTVELNTQVRNADQPALMELCSRLRTQVMSVEFSPIEEVPGVIKYCSEDELIDEMEKHFKNQNASARILTYTNNRSIMYGKYIRKYIHQYTEPYVVGERLINNNAIFFKGGGLQVEDEVVIDKINKIDSINIGGIDFEYYSVNLWGPRKRFVNVHLPKCKDTFNDMLKYFKKNKDWKNYFNLKNNYLDLRPATASTIHKAQGSTFDTVFIDLENLSTCHNPKVVARLLYVAFSRAKNRVYLWGRLPKKYGG